MTGHGQARFHNDQLQIAVEIRTVNNRHLKLNVHSDLDAETQAKIEALLRSRLHRGSVTLRISVKSIGEGQYELNEELIRAYWLQLSEIAGSSQSVNVESILALPGAVIEKTGADRDEIWPHIESTLDEALANLEAMRAQEGQAMQADMLGNIETIASRLESVRELAPKISEAYSKRLTDRIQALLEKHNIESAQVDILREVGIFAERVDIAEETVRLGTHLDHFRDTISSTAKAGRKLDFLVQEILRETNTIGSKANDSEIATHVVEIKTAIERIREMVQNVE
ncbi:Conserved hypothetical protein CHP00255 [Mariniblastus fucicola]|uniref:YicC-like family, N-terminal region n=2 Tax=Mariniblastus fucicola TaxID=980251 RepID=A0A5B9PFV7_9BACT|nr:Conserved hypothetical protein CHP00255 [Mariniblastus fucicola]